MNSRRMKTVSDRIRNYEQTVTFRKIPNQMATYAWLNGPGHFLNAVMQIKWSILKRKAH